MKISHIRHSVQFAVLVMLMYAGWRFYIFVTHFTTGGSTPFVPRPPSVEAFLPISAMVSLKSWISTGIIDTIHPAGLAIFIAALIVGIFYQRGFCSFLCPIGTFSEGLWRFGEKILGKNIRIPKVLDIPLRGIKYLLLVLFIKLIFIDMPGWSAYAFTQGSYNKVADAKMLVFWLEPTVLVIQVTVALILLSVLFKNFWCRDLCPYGAILGILGRISPFKVRRDPEVCIECGKCSKVCPGLIDVKSQKIINSLECIKCFRCLENCPKPGAIDLKLWNNEFAPVHYSLLLVATFFFIIFLAKITGHWESAVSYGEFSKLIPNMDMYSH